MLERGFGQFVLSIVLAGCGGTPSPATTHGAAADRDQAPKPATAPLLPTGPTAPTVLTDVQKRKDMENVSGSAILFLRDENGDERHAIWRVNLDGTGLVNLTPGEKLRRGQPFVAGGKAKTMFYDIRKENEVGTTFVSRRAGSRRDSR